MPELPSGTVTFLFTDVEGSTARWEHQSEAMRAALARHDAHLRAAIQGHDGHVVKTMGDAFHAAFARAQDAVAAALNAQHRLQSEPWAKFGAELGPLRVRMALHTGAAEERDGDYYGPPLNRAARLMSTGHGGQVLLSQTTYDLVRDDLPAGTSLIDLGEHRLKDLIRPERIFQLTHPDLPSDLPPLRTLDTRPNNLPLQATALLGREREVATARERLLQPEVRLLTFTGPGGTGKTRLSLQVAAELIDHFADGVFFVALGAIVDPALVPAAIAEVLEIRDLGSRSVLDSMKAYLRDRTVLLVLDNFEQVTSAAPVVAELLGAGPGLKILVTSRAPLELRGEHEFPVPPLALPDPAQLPRLDALSQYGAVALFVERAVAIRPDFAVTNENAPAVAEICVRLDGLPLAIELAAARIRLLNPQTMLERLERRLPLLTGGARDLPARQQTLRGAIAWSYDLLTSEEQALFRRLAVFVGGCTLEAAEAICDPDGDLGVMVLDGLASLIARSLLRQAEGPDGELRFTMLATIREYASEQLAASGELARLQARHLDHFLALGETAQTELRGPRQVEWLGRLDREHDNLLAALEWSCVEARTDPSRMEEAIRLVDALKRFWVMRGRVRASLPHVLALLSLAPAGSIARARVLLPAASLLVNQADYPASVSLADEALSVWRSLSDARGITVALVRRGRIAITSGNYQLATTLLEEARDRFRQSGGDADIEHSVATWLATLAETQGQHERARALFEEGLAESRARGDGHSVAFNLAGIARAWRAQGELDRTVSLLRECLELIAPLTDIACVELLLESLAGVLSDQGRPAEAAPLFGAAEALRERAGRRLAQRMRQSHDRDVAATRTALGDEAFEAARAEGRAMSFDQAVACAYEVLARIEQGARSAASGSTDIIIQADPGERT